MALVVPELESDLSAFRRRFGDMREAELASRIDNLRVALEAEMWQVRERSQTYLRWYSPPYDHRLGTHDAWTDPLLAEDVGLTRGNFNIARAVVDIWTALEAAKPPSLRAEPERVPPPPPSLDQNETLRFRMVHSALKTVEAHRATLRASRLRRYQRLDDFAYKAFVAHRRKNLYGHSWMKVAPNLAERRPMSHVLRNPTTVYPLFSDRDPNDLEMLLAAYQMNVNRANAKWGLGLPTRNGRLNLSAGGSGEYRDLNERWYNSDRTMLWVEEFWWREQQLDPRDDTVQESRVGCITRVANRIVKVRVYDDWELLPWVMWENADERDQFGWSEVANVIDINDEFNRRLSQEGDVVGNYSAPRFQLLNALMGRQIEMPGPFEMVQLMDQERIEQIVSRIDVFPTQSHFDTLFEMLHRTTGLPPIVWGMIANAQTSGRALSASWKATEARLAPKIMRNTQSYNRWLRLALQFAELYDWQGAEKLYTAADGEAFRDFTWDFPPMEPRDFMEVTQNEITKRDAGLTTTLKAIRSTGDEAPEDTLDEIMAEKLNIFLHPSDVQAYLLATRAQLDNIAYARELGVPLEQGDAGPGQGGGLNPVTVAEAVGLARDAQQAGPTPAAAGPAPATQPGAQGNLAAGSPGQPPGSMLTSGTLVRNGEVSNQMLETRRY